MLDRTEHHAFPGSSSRETSELGTPATRARFVNNTTGAPFGLQLRYHQIDPLRPRDTTPILGLFTVGTSTDWGRALSARCSAAYTPLPPSPVATDHRNHHRRSDREHFGPASVGRRLRPPGRHPQPVIGKERSIADSPLITLSVVRLINTRHRVVFRVRTPVARSLLAPSTHLDRGSSRIFFGANENRLASDHRPFTAALRAKTGYLAMSPMKRSCPPTCP